MQFKEAKRVLTTIKHLKAKQLFYQCYYRVFKNGIIFQNQNDNINLKPWCAKWSAPYASNEVLTKFGEVSFLNEKVNIHSSLNWHDSNRPKLWLYNLHYFDLLNSQYADLHFELLNDLIQNWIINNQYNQGTGWEPYVVSLRIVNWVKWFSQHQINKKEWLDSLNKQAESLIGKIEYHLLGNHLFTNAKALIFIGVYLNSTRAKVLLQKGLTILNKEISRQLLPDGGHCELSPMYHSIILWDLCDLINLANCCGLPELQNHIQQWKEALKNGVKWLELICHPDGMISFFNDSALGVAPTLNDIKSYMNYLKIEETIQPSQLGSLSCQLLKDSGYCVINLPNDSKAILDVAKVGLDYQPGHAHADTLAFELSLHSQRFIVNSGTSTYEIGVQRAYERSTKAHNTVLLNNTNSSDVWASFRVGNRANPKNFLMNNVQNKIQITCEHDGYKPLIHRRQWSFSDRELIIKDTIDGEGKKEAEARFYLHPDVKIISNDNQVIKCQLKENQIVYIQILEGGNYSVESTFWYPHFNNSVPNQCLLIRFNGNQILTRVYW